MGERRQSHLQHGQQNPPDSRAGGGEGRELHERLIGNPGAAVMDSTFIFIIGFFDNNIIIIIITISGSSSISMSSSSWLSLAQQGVFWGPFSFS